MRMTARILWLYAMLTALALAQHRGEKPPALVWDRLKGSCPATLEWTSLKVKVTVLLFSPDGVSTEDIAEANDIRNRFQDEPVIVIHVVSGSEFLLDQSLKTTPYPGCILFDRQAENARNFKIPAFARTVVVDQSGTIAGYAGGPPDEASLRSILNYQVASGLSDAPPPQGHYHMADGSDIVPSSEVHIAPAREGELHALVDVASDRYVAANFPLKLIVLDLWDWPAARISFPQDLDQRNFDVTARLPLADRDFLLRLVHGAIEKHFGLRIAKEIRTQPVYLLTAACYRR